MTVLTVAIAQPNTKGSMNPTAMRQCISAIDEVLTATISLAASRSKEGKAGEFALTEGSTVSFVPRLKTSSVIEGRLAAGMAGALELINVSSGAVALETIPDSDPNRKYFARINRALAVRGYVCTISFGGQNYTLRDLGLASHAYLGTPWNGPIVMVPDSWHSGPKLVLGKAEGLGNIELDLAHHPEVYSSLLAQNPKVIEFLGRGHRNKQLLRVIPESTPKVVEPSMALGELPFPPNAGVA